MNCDFPHLKAVAWLKIRYGITLLIVGQPIWLNSVSFVITRC